MPKHRSKVNSLEKEEHRHHKNVSVTTTSQNQEKAPPIVFSYGWLAPCSELGSSVSSQKLANQKNLENDN